MVGMQHEEYMNRYPNELAAAATRRRGKGDANDPDIVLMDEFSRRRSDNEGPVAERALKLQECIKRSCSDPRHRRSD